MQELIDSKIITPRQAENHPQKNIITKALTPEEMSEPDIAVEPIVLYEGDIFLECTDGLTGYISDAQIFNIVSSLKPDEAADKLVDMVLETEARDNITVQIIKVLNGKKIPVNISVKNKIIESKKSIKKSIKKQIFREIFHLFKMYVTFELFIISFIN